MSREVLCGKLAHHGKGGPRAALKALQLRLLQLPILVPERSLSDL